MTTPTLANLAAEVLVDFSKILLALKKNTDAATFYKLVDSFTLAEGMEPTVKITLDPVKSTNVRADDPAGYRIIHETVTSLGLESKTEDLLWFYPFYRQIVENNYSLSQPVDREKADVLLQDAHRYAHKWINQMVKEKELQDIAKKALKPPRPHLSVVK